MVKLKLVSDFKSLSIIDKTITITLLFSLTTYAYYYCFPFKSDFGSTAPVYMKYLFWGAYTFPVVAIGIFCFFLNSTKIRSLKIYIVFGIILLSLIAKYPIDNPIDKEFAKIFIFIGLIFCFYEILSYSGRGALFLFTSNLLVIVIGIQSIFNIVLWSIRHELWLQRQVGLLGNPSIMGLFTLISLISVSIKFVNEKNVKNYLVAFFFMFSLFLVGAKFCTLLYPFLLTLLMVFNRKETRFFLLLIGGYGVLLILIQMAPKSFPPILVSTTSDSYITRVAPFQANANTDTNTNADSGSTSKGISSEPEISSKFGSIDNQFIDLYRGVGGLPAFLILAPLVFFGLARIAIFLNIKKVRLLDIVFAILLISLLVYRPLFYFPVSLFFAISISEILVRFKSNVSPT